MFQSNYANAHTLYSDMTAVYKSLLCFYMNNTYVKITKVKDIDPGCLSNFVPFHQMYLGVKVTRMLCQEHIASDKVQIDDFFVKCRSFMIKLAQELRSRLPFDNDIFEILQFLDPKVSVQGTIPSLVHVCNKFPTMFDESSITDIDSEWRALLFCSEAERLLQDMPSISVEDFWHKVSLIRDSNSQKLCFPSLSRFARDLLCLPVSNAACERVFSSVNLIKTKLRNRFSTESVANIIFAKQGLQGACHDFNPSKEMLARFDAQIYATANDNIDDDLDEEDE